MKTLFTTLKKAQLRYRGFMLFYIVAAIIGIFGLIVSNRFLGDVSQAAVDGQTDLIVWLLGIVTAIFFVRILASAAADFFMARFSANAGYKLRHSFINYFLKVPFAEVEKSASGENLSIFSNDIPQTRTFVSSGILGLVTNIISFIGALSFMLLISPLFTLFLFIGAVVVMLLLALISAPIQKLSVKSSEEKAKYNAIFNDSLQNLSTITAYSLEGVLEERYLTAYNKYFAIILRIAKVLAVMIALSSFLLFVPVIVVFSVFAISVIDGNITLAEFVAFVTTMTIILATVSTLGQSLGELRRWAGSAQRFNDATAKPLEEMDTADYSSVSDVCVKFENVSFAYGESGEPALTDISFNIPAGSKIAIVGSSGSGKSTLLKILLGLYEPTEGSISINGDTKTKKAQMREFFSYVPQNTFLFPESIGQNITLEAEITDMPRLEKACSNAHILDFINSLPDKFSSTLKEGADNISGGQRQRIAIARALYKNAPIILLDEATSALDLETESTVLDTFKQSKKTVIMVAHRHSAIAVCDTIIVMDKGKVCAIGSHGELIKNSEIYRKFYEERQGA
ncbi:MAG: ABC transporter ATP-binding protein/permease [Defluviitaleaceae bacterium]|nr:ABC transporter ATP-binding protein/permease [Defluviitaleaceae bacterium]